jgi:hypothetical protein
MDVGLPKWTIQIPLTYNDGSEIPRDVLDQIKDEIFVLSNGYQIGEPITGAYQMADGTRKVEKMLPISLGVLDENVPDLEKMTAKFAAVLGQETLYLERTGGTMYFIPPSLPSDSIEAADATETPQAMDDAAGGEGA